jgi:hypothetical protein
MVIRFERQVLSRGRAAFGNCSARIQDFKLSQTIDYSKLSLLFDAILRYSWICLSLIKSQSSTFQTICHEHRPQLRVALAPRDSLLRSGSCLRFAAVHLRPSRRLSAALGRSRRLRSGPRERPAGARSLGRALRGSADRCSPPPRLSGGARAKTAVEG